MNLALVLFALSNFFAVKSEAAVTYLMEAKLSGSYSSECRLLNDSPCSGAETTSVPMGWGVMSPAIIFDGTNQYAPLYFGCGDSRSTRGDIGCMYLIKNGSVHSDLLSFKYSVTSTPAGYSTSDIAGSYQPPMMFKYGNELVVAVWIYFYKSGSGNGVRSTVYLFSTDLTGSAPLSWTQQAFYVTPDSNLFNYLGGASNGSQIVISGRRQVDGSNIRLELIKATKSGSTWSFSGPTIVASLNYQYDPVYPHVLIKDDGTYRVFTTMQESRGGSCDGVGTTKYMNVAEYYGSWLDNGFTAQWSNQVSISPCTTDSNYYNQYHRFAMDFMCDNCGDNNTSNDEVYAIYRKTETSGSPAVTTTTFPLVKNGTILDDDIGAYFTSFEPFTHISMTKMGDGRFAFLANHQHASGNTEFAIVTTTDFSTYSAPEIRDTDFSVGLKIGVGNSIKVAQPSKNGSSVANDVLHFAIAGDYAHSGNLRNAHNHIYYKVELD